MWANTLAFYLAFYPWNRTARWISQLIIPRSQSPSDDFTGKEKNLKDLVNPRPPSAFSLLLTSLRSQLLGRVSGMATLVTRSKQTHMHSCLTATSGIGWPGPWRRVLSLPSPGRVWHAQTSKDYVNDSEHISGTRSLPSNKFFQVHYDVHICVKRNQMHRDLTVCYGWGGGPESDTACPCEWGRGGVDQGE